MPGYLTNSSKSLAVAVTPHLVATQWTAKYHDIHAVREVQAILKPSLWFSLAGNLRRHQANIKLAVFGATVGSDAFVHWRCKLKRHAQDGVLVRIPAGSALLHRRVQQHNNIPCTLGIYRRGVHKTSQPSPSSYSWLVTTAG